MQTIAAFAASAAHAVGSVAATAGHAVMTGARFVAGAGQAGAHAVQFVSTPGTLAKAAAGIGQGASAGSKVLQALRIGTSVVSALSVYSQSRAQADAMQRESFDEGLQVTAEFTQSQERAAAIQREYNQFVEQSLAFAGASGIDLGSGSVLEAREAAQRDADRAATIDREGTFRNAALRRSRAGYLRSAAGQTRAAGFVGGTVKIGEGILDARKAG